MAPMIDMVFLLLVFFMTVSTMATGAKPEITLADSNAARVPENAPVRTYLSCIPGDGEALFIGNVPVKESSLTDSLEEIRSRFPDGELVLRVSRRAVWKDYGALLKKAGQAGFSDITLATYEGG